MTDEDRELLEMAARAIGGRLLWRIVEVDEVVIRSTPVLDVGSVNTKPWKPLADDGDALRLAVTLNIRTKRYQGMITAEYPANDGIHEWRVLHEPVLDDYFAATRRAIVRAAAEIGRAMK